MLEALIPYTKANLKLSFKPNSFFNELERIDRQKAWQKQKANQQHTYKKENLRNAFYRAKAKGFIVMDEAGNPRLTDLGRKFIQPYMPKKLGKSAKLLIIFDIPEPERYKRRHLRTLLKELKFSKVQQSVWSTSYDHREIIEAEIKALSLQKYVQVYEALKII